MYLPHLQAQGLRELREVQVLFVSQMRVHAEACFSGIVVYQPALAAQGDP